MADPASSTADQRAAMGAAMRDFMAHAVLFQDAVARSVGLNSSDLQAVGLLMTEGPASPRELAARLGMTAGGAITGLVDRLEKAGYVRRQPDEHDRRRVLVVPDHDRVAVDVGAVYARIGARWDEYLGTLAPAEVELGTRILTAAARINQEELEQLRP